MQEITKCETVYVLPSDELIEKLGIDSKYEIENVITNFHMGGRGRTSETNIEIKLQPIVSKNKISTTTCSKSFILDKKEFMEKLGLEGICSYAKLSSNNIKHNQVHVNYQSKTVD